MSDGEPPVRKRLKVREVVPVLSPKRHGPDYTKGRGKKPRRVYDNQEDAVRPVEDPIALEEGGGEGDEASTSAEKTQPERYANMGSQTRCSLTSPPSL